VKQVEILVLGRIKDRHWVVACEEYFGRCRRRATISLRELRDVKQLLRALPRPGVLVALDEGGEGCTSRAFARKLDQWLSAPPPLAFLIGGVDGLDRGVRQRADAVLSLSEMTFPHQMVPLILAEQLYRAVSILDGSPYHRG
jgi:23S rRNA (pseudouridine1915-N3)-methyltransferase